MIFCYIVCNCHSVVFPFLIDLCR